jgi:hypothetical protein
MVSWEMLMPNKLRFTLLLLSVLPILSLASVAMAAKKPPEANTIVLKAGPVIGGIFTCDVTNYTGQPIAILIEWCSGPRGNPGIAASCGTANLTLQPSANYGVGDLNDDFNALYATDCTVEYSGFAGDISGVLCGTTGCVPLN